MHNEQAICAEEFATIMGENVVLRKRVEELEDHKDILVGKLEVEMASHAATMNRLNHYLKALEGVREEATRIKAIVGGLPADRSVAHAVADNFEAIATEATKEEP